MDNRFEQDKTLRQGGLRSAIRSFHKVAANKPVGAREIPLPIHRRRAAAEYPSSGNRQARPLSSKACRRLSHSFHKTYYFCWMDRKEKIPHKRNPKP